MEAASQRRSALQAEAARMAAEGRLQAVDEELEELRTEVEAQKHKKVGAGELLQGHGR